MLLPRELGARTIPRMGLQRFLDEIIRLSAQILTHGGRLICRLLAINQWTKLLPHEPIETMAIYIKHVNL